MRHGSNGTSAKFEMVNRATANAWLATSPHNRVIKEANLGKLERSLRNGDWQVNGEPIIIDDHGQLMDGHHRLKAIANTGISVECLVVRGIAREAERSIDTGSARTAGDTLRFHGYPNAERLGAAVTILWKYITGTIYENGARIYRPTPTEVLGLVESCPGVVSQTIRTAWFPFVPKGTAAFLNYYCSEDSECNVSDFLNEVAGVEPPSSKNSPAFLLHRRILSDKLKVNAFMNWRMRFALIVKSYNCYRADIELGTLRIRRNAASPEDWPYLNCSAPDELIRFSGRHGFTPDALANK